jgi:two-component system response regulator YesN
MKKALSVFYSNLSIKTKLLFSYVLLFMIPLCILGVGGYQWISDTVSNYAEKAYSTMMEKTIRENDNVFKQLDTLAKQLSNTTWVRKIIFMQGDEVDENRMDAWAKMEYTQSIYALRSAMKPITELGIIFDDKDLVIASYGSSDTRFLYGNAFRVDGMDDTDWKSLISGLKNGESRILPARTVTKFNVPVLGIVYIRSIGYDMTVKKSRNALFAFIPQKSIEENLQTLFIDEGISVTVFDKDDNQFLQMGEKEVLTPLNISQQSDYSGWKYTMSIPRRLIVKNAESVRNIILASIGILCAICLAVAFGFMRNIYRPVGELVAMVSSQIRNGPGKNTRNEYAWLQNGIHAMVEQENALMGELENRRPILRDTWLRKLITGDINPRQEYEKALAMLDVAMPYPFWRACSVTLREKAGAEENQAVSGSGMFDSFVRGQAPFTMNGLVAYACNAMDSRRLIVNYQEEEVFSEFADKCIHALPEALIGVGNACQSLDGVASSCQEAAIAIDCRLIGQDHQIIRFSDISTNRASYSFPLDLEYQISSCLKCGDAQTAIALFRTILENNLQHHGISHESINNLLINMELTALKVLDETLSAKSFIADNHVGYSTKSYTEMSNHIEQRFQAIGDLILERNATYPSSFEKIIRFVDASITDNSLSLSMVADHCNMSLSYISRMFTEYAGKNFHAYVNEKRIAIARDLLLVKSDITSVARAAGYESNVTFRRLFRQYMGLSPSEYRDQQKNTKPVLRLVGMKKPAPGNEEASSRVNGL